MTMRFVLLNNLWVHLKRKKNNNRELARKAIVLRCYHFCALPRLLTTVRWEGPSVGVVVTSQRWGDISRGGGWHISGLGDISPGRGQDLDLRLDQQWDWGDKEQISCHSWNTICSNTTSCLFQRQWSNDCFLWQRKLFQLSSVSFGLQFLKCQESACFWEPMKKAHHWWELQQIWPVHIYLFQECGMLENDVLWSQTHSSTIHYAKCGGRNQVCDKSPENFVQLFSSMEFGKGSVVSQ